VFAVDAENDQGSGTVRLVQAADTPIRRHQKIKGEANPYDPQWEEYFEGRLGLQMKEATKGKIRLLRLWWSQDKVCAHCGERITRETGWNVHHITPKHDGGRDTLSNLVLLHPNCHRKIHSQGITVVKPDSIQP
jgi:RNA-directed DNA polymerase